MLMVQSGERKELKTNVICCSIHDVLCAVITNNTYDKTKRTKRKIIKNSNRPTLFTFPFAKKNGYLK